MTEDSIDCSAMLNYDPDDPDSRLRMEEFIRRNKDKMAKLTPAGEAKMREASEDASSIKWTKEPDIYERVVNYGECLGKYRLIEEDLIKGIREIVFNRQTGEIFSEAYIDKKEEI